jgi:hypothetical protein
MSDKMDAKTKLAVEIAERITMYAFWYRDDLRASEVRAISESLVGPEITEIARRRVAEGRVFEPIETE